MSVVGYQTISLSKGKHASPEEGACVMELASMLAGEPFSDHPASVCPVIGSLLRAYNDTVGDERRQDLYAYAAKVVGSRTGAEAQNARAERMASWVPGLRRRRRRRFVPPALARAISSRWRPPIECMGAHAVHSISTHTDETHASILALVDELLAIGAPGNAPPPPGTVSSMAADGESGRTSLPAQI